MFIENLRQVWRKQNSFVCVGLDPEKSRLPQCLIGHSHPLFEFNRRIIDATAEFVCAYKPQIAYYSAVRAEDELEMTIEYIHAHYPGLPVILDSKRGDVGSTAHLYASEAFDRYRADAVTVNPYLGFDSLTPFLDRKDKGVILLCRTSNAGAMDLQDLSVEGGKLFHQVAKLASGRWNAHGNVLLVMGATYPRELAEVRAIVGDMPFLVPGVGAQGGDVDAVVGKGKDSHGAGLIISSSRAIIYASSAPDFAEAAAHATRELRDKINAAKGTA